MKLRIKVLSIGLMLILSLSACEKMIDITPNDVLLAEDAIKSPQDLQNLLASCYDAIANRLDGEAQFYNDLLADDVEKPFRDDNGFRTEIWNRNTNIFNSSVRELYQGFYTPVFRINSMDDYYDKLTELTSEEEARIRGEASFLRALCHFEVVKLWANPAGFTADNSHPGIPIRKVTSREGIQRSTTAEVYAYIISELQFAITNLPSDNGNYADKNAAKALLAMVYFQMNDFANARPLLDDVINNGGYTLSDSIDRYHPNRAGLEQEFIFSFVSVNGTDNRGDDFIGNYRNDVGTANVGIRREIYNLIKDDSTDIRGNLVGVVNEGQANEYFICRKFNNDYFACPYLTLTQMLLTRAEVAAELGDAGTASDDLNLIIARAYPGNAAKLTSAGLGAANLLVIARTERRKELFCEGDRVQSLKRIGARGTNSLVPNSAVTIRSAPWNCPGLALQFPSTEQTSVFIMNETGGCN